MLQGTPDVALYYTVDVKYYSGTVDNSPATPNPRPLTTAGLADVVAQCSTTGQAALTAAQVTVEPGASLVVRCPANADCAADTTAVHTSTDGAYLFTSSVCRAAIHAGVISNTAGGTFRLTLAAGADVGDRTWSTGKGIACMSWLCAAL